MTVLSSVPTENKNLPNQIYLLIYLNDNKALSLRLHNKHNTTVRSAARFNRLHQAKTVMSETPSVGRSNVRPMNTHTNTEY